MITKEMTNEDRELAIIYLKEMQETYIEGDGYERHPLPEYYAIETALEALKQEPCEDCVSREKAMAIGEKLFMLPLETEEDVEDAFEYFKRQIKDLPPVTPTGYKMKPTEQESCEDVVSRQEVLEVLKNNRYRFNISQEGYCEGKVLWSENLIKDDACKEIEQLPCITPTRKKGHWIKIPLVEAGQTYSHMCSLCGRRILVTAGLSEFPYCHCGAKMEV